MIEQPTHRCACIVLQNAEGKYLLQMRDNTPGIQCPLMWDGFGGGIEEGEEPLAGALRELKEELDVDASPEDLEPLGALMLGGRTQYYFKLKRPVSWKDFSVNEGAGAAFFFPEDMALLPAAEPVRAFFVERRTA